MCTHFLHWSPRSSRMVGFGYSVKCGDGVCFYPDSALLCGIVCSACRMSRMSLWTLCKTSGSSVRDQLDAELDAELDSQRTRCPLRAEPKDVFI